jgi:hypothetical protein
VLSTHDHHHHYYYYYYYYYYRYTVKVNGESAPCTCSVMASSRALIIPMEALGAAMPMTKQSTLTQVETPTSPWTNYNNKHIACGSFFLVVRSIIIINVQAGVFVSQPLIVDGNIRKQGSQVFNQFSSLHNEMRPRGPPMRAPVCVHPSSHVL